MMNLSQDISYKDIMKDIMINNTCTTGSFSYDSYQQYRYIYVMISQTYTKVGRIIRTLGRVKYNHAAISLDADLERMYAFARKQHNALLPGRLVSENVYRYTLGRADDVQVVIFRIRVPLAQYRWIERTIQNIQSDDTYIYNFLSVLTYPIFRGFETYKAFSCMEFVMYILSGAGFKLSRPLHSYTPDELLEYLDEFIYYDGNLLDYKDDGEMDEDYFAPFTRDTFKMTIVEIKILLVRLVMSHRAGSWK